MKQTLYYTGAMISELGEQAARLELSGSRVMQAAVALAKPELAKLRTSTGFDDNYDE